MLEQYLESLIHGHGGKNGVALRRNSHAGPFGRQIGEIGYLTTRYVVKTVRLLRTCRCRDRSRLHPAAFHAIADLRDETLPLLRNIVQRFGSVVRLQARDQQWAETFETWMESGVESFQIRFGCLHGLPLVDSHRFHY